MPDEANDQPAYWPPYLALEVTDFMDKTTGLWLEDIIQRKSAGRRREPILLTKFRNTPCTLHCYHLDQ